MGGSLVTLPSRAMETYGRSTEEGNVTTDSMSDGLPGSFGVAAVLLVFTLSFFRIYEIAPIVGVSITVVDIAIGLLGLAWLGLVLVRRRIAIPRRGIHLLVAGAAFVCYLVLRAPPSAVPREAVTFVLLAVRDLALVGLVVSTLEASALDRVNRAVYRISVVMATGAILAYLLVLTVADPPDILLQTVMNLDWIQARSRWLVGDPNFFSLYLTLGVLVGAHRLWRTRRWSLVPGLGVLTVAILIAGSRTVVLLFVGFAVLITIWRWITLSSVRSPDSFARLVAGAALIVAVLMISGVWKRFVSVSFDRFGLWRQVIESIDVSTLLFGEGLRASQVLLDGYVHNSYLEILHDTGLVGLTIYGIVVGTVLVPAGRDVLHNYDLPVFPWVVMLLFVLGFMIPFSFELRPIVWLVLAVLAVGSDGPALAFLLSRRPTVRAVPSPAESD